MGCSALLWGILFCISLHLAMRPGHVDLKGTRISWRPLNKEWGTSPKVRGNIHSLYSQQYQASAGSICWSKFPVKIGVVSSSCWVGSPVGLRKWCPLLRWSMLYLRIPQCFRSGTCTTLGTAVEIGELFSTANSKLQDRQPGVELKHPFKKLFRISSVFPLCIVDILRGVWCFCGTRCLAWSMSTLSCLSRAAVVSSFMRNEPILGSQVWPRDVGVFQQYFVMCLESGLVCGWDSAHRKQMPDSQRSWTNRIWEDSNVQSLVLPVRKHQRHNAASNGQQILLDLQNYVLFLPVDLCGSMCRSPQMTSLPSGKLT